MTSFMNRKEPNVRNLKQWERGQALVVIALAAVVLFGFVALAIDGSIKFSDRRHAQNAADTAALAGALALVNDETDDVVVGGVVIGVEWKLAALDRASDNGYDSDLVTNQVWIFKCSDALNTRGGAPLDCGPYEGDSEHISVIVLSHVDTYFARVLGFNQTHNLVQAVTYWNKRGPMYDGNLIVALNPDPCSGGDGNVHFGGSSAVTLTGGGAYVNSGGSDCGMEYGGTCPIINGGSIGSSGDGNINLDGCSDLPAPGYNGDPYPFPPEMPDEPEECDVSNPGSFSSNSATQTTTLEPGRYNEFPPKSGGGVTVYDNMVMNPGIYCVNEVVKLSDQHLNLFGHNVTIYIRSGYDFNIQQGTIILDAPDDGPYAGYLFIVDSDFTGQVPNCIINGDSSNTYTGTIFAPYCDITINGGNQTTSYTAQVIGYTVTILGNADTDLYYDINQSAQSDPKLGLMR
jgi:hypothetical protein